MTGDVHAPPDTSTLKAGALGTTGLTFIVMSAAAPLTVMAGVAPLALLIGGVGAPVGYLAAGAVLIIFAVGFTAMTRHVRGAGAFYAYITRGLGRPVGIASGVLALVSYNALQIGMYGLLAVQTRAALLDLFGWDIPWPAIAVVAVVVVWLLGYLGVDVGAKVLGVLLTAETAILLWLAIAVVAAGGADGLSGTSFTPAAMFAPGMASVLGICFAAFMGFESTVLYREETRDPERTVPRATYIAVAAMALLYAFVVWAIVQAFGDSNIAAVAGGNTADMFFLAMDEYVGPWATDLMRVLIVTSVYATLLAFHNAINRYTYALSRDRVLPVSFGRVHPRHRSPFVAGVGQTVLALAVVAAFAATGADPFLQLLLWVNTPGVIGVLALQVLTAVAVTVFFIRSGLAPGSPRTVIAAAVASVLLMGATVLVVDNIDLLTLASSATNIVLVAVAPVAFVAGLIGAAFLRSRRREIYRNIGSSESER